MATTEPNSGDLLLTGSAQTLATLTADAVYETHIDLSTLADGDTVEIWVDTIVKSLDSAISSERMIFENGGHGLVIISGITVTQSYAPRALQSATGTFRTIPWTIRKIA